MLLPAAMVPLPGSQSLLPVSRQARLGRGRRDELGFAGADTPPKVKLTSGTGISVVMTPTFVNGEEDTNGQSCTVIYSKKSSFVTFA
jgi:hypothetical protein